MAGPKYSSQRAKTSKHMKSATQKVFKENDSESKKRYAAKMNARMLRKAKRK